MRNYALLVLGIANTIEGVVGLFGYKFSIPSKYEGHTWTKKYIQGCGISRIIFGIPWIILSFVIWEKEFDLKTAIIIAVIGSLPSLAYDVLNSIKYRRMLKQEMENQP